MPGPQTGTRHFSLPPSQGHVDRGRPMDSSRTPGRVSSVDWSWISSRLTRVVLPAYFFAHSTALVAIFLVEGLVGIDARIYSAAVRVWMEGGDPWATAVDGFYFAAPPPTLLPFVPFAVLGESLSAAIWVGGSAAAAVFIVRSLGLTWWWILFPPITNGVLAGNADVLVVALVLARSDVLGTIASFLKIYALLPILGDRRWRTLAMAGVALLITAPVLPWGTYVGQFSEIAAILDAQALGISAFGTLWLIVLVVIALAALGQRLAGWLAVPALWPSAQLHYSVLALPALASLRHHPLAVLVAAIMLSPEVVWLPPLAVVVLALAITWSRIQRRRRVGLDERIAIPS